MRNGAKEITSGSPYTPTTTGAVERFNQTLISKIRKPSNFGVVNLKDILQKAVQGYNISPSRATGVSPYDFEEMEQKGGAAL